MNEQNLPPYNPYPVSLPTSTMAIVSLVAGILGFTFLPAIGTVVALIAGTLARQETRSVPPKAAGDGLATAGIVMGWIQVGLSVLGSCFAFIYVAFIATWLASQ